MGDRVSPVLRWSKFASGNAKTARIGPVAIIDIAFSANMNVRPLIHTGGCNMIGSHAANSAGSSSS